MYSDGRPVSLVDLQQMIGGRLSILIVGVAREVVVLLSFRFDLSRSLRLPNVPNGATNKATKGFMDGCSNIWLHYRHSWTHLRPESTLNRPQSRTKPLFGHQKRSIYSYSHFFPLRQSDVVGRRLEEDVQSDDGFN